MMLLVRDVAVTMFELATGDRVMTSNSRAMASNLRARASNLRAMASKLRAMASNLYNSDGLKPNEQGPPT